MNKRKQIFYIGFFVFCKGQLTYILHKAFVKNRRLLFLKKIKNPKMPKELQLPSKDIKPKVKTKSERKKEEKITIEHVKQRIKGRKEKLL